MNQHNFFAWPDTSFPTCLLLRSTLLFACLLACLSLWAGDATAPESNFEHRTFNTPPPPSWSINPSDYQFNMNMVFRVRYNGVPDNAPGSIVGAFVGSELRGFATGVLIAGQMYYFVTIFSNVYTGETIRFRTYYAPDDKIYASTETVVFTHHKLASTIDAPFWLNLDPTADFPPELLPILADTTLQNIPFDPVPLTSYLNSPDGDPVIWTAQPGVNLTATIINGVMTVTPLLPSWIGTDTVRVIVTENTPNQKSAHVTALFTVLSDYGPPVLSTIPSQTIFPGGTFTTFDLDSYLTFAGPCRKFDFDVFPYTGTVPDPNWPAPTPGAPTMTVIARPLFADEVLAGAGAKLAAFANNILLGTASPTGIAPDISYSLTLQNLGTGPITFRFYHAVNQYLYEKVTTLAFTPGATVGSVAAPFAIQLSPLVPTLAPNGSVEVTVADTSWLGTYPVDFIVWDCNFPDRRDTVRAFFSVGADNRPHITSPPGIDFKEGACYALYDAQTTDPIDSEGSGLTYSLAGGADVGKFSIDPVTGKLSWFNFTPDFESPGDANGDNKYEVIIRVTNSMALTDELTLLVKVTNNLVETFLPQVNGGVTAVCLLGSVTLQASGGIMYQWSTGAFTTSISVTTIGTYTVTITNDVGCSGSVVVMVSNRPTITASGSAAPVCLGSPITLGSTPTGGSGIYTSFAWAGPNGFTATVEDPASFAATAQATGTYTVTMTDNAGCTATATTVITTAGNSAPTIAAYNYGPYCVGVTLNVISIPAGGSGTYTLYKWAGPNNYNSASQNPGGFPASLIAAGTYTVTVTDNSGCTATGSTTVEVKPLPVITITTNSPLCVGGTVILSSTPSGGYGAYNNFAWTGPNSFTAAVEDPASFPATLAANGTYTVTVTDNTGCTGTGSAVVSVTGLPSITATLLGPVCTGGTVNLASTPTGGSTPYATFQWQGSNSFTAGVEDPAPIPVVPAVAGAYTVTVTDKAGCSATGSVTVVVNPIPAITASNNGPVCQGGNLLLTSTPSAGSGIYSLFQWIGPDNYVASVEDPAAFSTTLASLGIYTVKVTDSKGCTATATTDAAVNPKPSITATSNTPVCVSANINLMSTPSGGSGVYSTFAWTKSGGGYTANQEDPPGFPATLATAGTYQVLVTDNKGCTATATTSVAISSLVAPIITPASNSPLCGGQNIILTSSPSSGSGTYAGFLWTGPNNFNVAAQNPVPFVATGAAAGIYTVKVTDSKGCIGTNTLTVVVNAPKATPTSNGPLCAGSTVLLSAGPSGSTGGYLFNWAGPNMFSSIVENPPGFPASASTVGTYTVTITDNANCTASGTVTIVIEPNDPPTITCPTDQEVIADANCSGVVGNRVPSATNVTDDCTPQANILVTQMPAAGTAFLAVNTEIIVTLTANDGINTASCTFKVTLRDKTPPVIVCPPDQTVMADNNCSGIVGTRSPVTLSDNCPANLTVTQMPAPGTVLMGHTDFETVTLTANDGNGNIVPCSFKVTLKDVTPPVITCPSDKTLAADNECKGLVGAWDPLTVSDNCPGSLVVTQAPPANTVLMGHDDFETVVLTADDGHGNMASCSFKVTLKDVTPPTITCPAPITKMSDLNSCGAVVNYVVTASDNCGLASNIPFWGLQSGVPFPGGTTIVIWLATDLVGLTATCEFTVTIVDGQNPSIVCPQNIVKMTDPNQCSAVVVYPTPTFADNCPGVSITRTNGPASGSVFPKGTQTVNWEAADGTGKTAICNFTVTVTDGQAPTITCPTNVSKTTDLNACSAVVTYTTPTFTDNCIGATGALLSGGASGTAFQKGTSTVVWKATDGVLLLATCSFSVTVTDGQQPSVTCPANIIKTTSPNVCTAVTTYPTPTFTDNCAGGSVAIQSGLPSGSAFLKGATTVVWRATDAVGLTRTCTFRVTVNDAQAPNIVCPASQTKNTDAGICTTPATYANATFTDNCSGGSVVRVSGLASGSIFPRGVNNVVFRATDAAGNLSFCTMTITVNDGQLPVITCPANIVRNNDLNQCYATVTYTVTVTDNCSGATSTLTTGLASGSVFPIGSSTHIWRATDAGGNSTTCSFSVIVNDTQLPTAVCAPDTTMNVAQPTCTFPATQLTPPTVGDNCLVSSVTNNAPANLPIGSTTVVWTATDPANNAKACVRVVTVVCVGPPEFSPLDVRNPEIEHPAEGRQLVSMNLAPNPATSFVTVTLLGLDENGGDLLVFDPLGRLILRQKLAGGQRTAELNAGSAEFSTGLYQVSLRTQNGVVTKELVVSRL